MRAIGHILWSLAVFIRFGNLAAALRHSRAVRDAAVGQRTDRRSDRRGTRRVVGAPEITNPLREECLGIFFDRRGSGVWRLVVRKTLTVCDLTSSLGWASIPDRSVSA